jgi:hypothetical protein
MAACSTPGWAPRRSRDHRAAEADDLASGCASVRQTSGQRRKKAIKRLR